MTCFWFCNKWFCNKKGAWLVLDPVLSVCTSVFSIVNAGGGSGDCWSSFLLGFYDFFLSFFFVTIANTSLFICVKIGKQTNKPPPQFPSNKQSSLGYGFGCKWISNNPEINLQDTTESNWLKKYFFFFRKTTIQNSGTKWVVPRAAIKYRTHTFGWTLVKVTYLD